HPGVVLGVGDARVVECVVAVVGLLDERAQLGGPFDGLFEWALGRRAVLRGHRRRIYRAPVTPIPRPGHSSRQTLSVQRWVLVAVWVTLPLTAGPAASDALSSWSTAPRIVAEILLWGTWAVGLLAVVAPRPPLLTAARTIAPTYLVLAVA